MGHLGRKIGTGIATAAAGAVIMGVYSLLGNHEKSKYDELTAQCIALGGTPNPGSPPVLLKTATGTPPTCIH